MSPSCCQLHSPHLFAHVYCINCVHVIIHNGKLVMIFNALLTIFNLVITYELDTYIIWGGGVNPKKPFLFQNRKMGFFNVGFFCG